MSTLHISWIVSDAPGGNDPGAMINDIVTSESVTTSGTSAQSGTRPAVATHALCSSIDAAHYVTPYGVSIDAAAANESIYIPTGQFRVIRVPQSGKVAAITA